MKTRSDKTTNEELHAELDDLIDNMVNDDILRVLRHADIAEPLITLHQFMALRGLDGISHYFSPDADEICDEFEKLDFKKQQAADVGEFGIQSDNIDWR